MITVRFCKNEELILPETLGRSLGLREGDRVKVRRRDGVLRIQRHPGPLTDLARVVSSSLPVGSADVERYMDRHGHEQTDGRSDDQGANGGEYREYDLC